MDKKAELLAQLKKVEEDEKNEYINKQLQHGQKYINKCYSSHLFQRLPVSGKEIVLRKIESCYWDKGNECVYYKGKQITFKNFRTYGSFTFEISEVSSKDPFPSWISSWSHEISPDLFNQVLEQTVAHTETYFDKVKELFKQDYLIRNGDHNDDNNKFELLLSSGAKFIKLKKEGYESILDYLRWYNHPFIYGEDNLLDTKQSIEIIKILTDNLEKEAISWGGSVLQRDRPRIKKLREFYNLHKYDG